MSAAVVPRANKASTTNTLAEDYQRLYMKKTSFKIENLLDSFPNDREKILLYVDRVKKYSNECGCSMGAKFLMASIGIFLIYFFHSNDCGIANLLKEFLFGMLFIFTSSIIGKLIGIGIARIRLARLSKYLIGKYHVLGE